jgi:hypothetical protein
MHFSCERPNDEMKAFMQKASIDSRPACNAVTMPLYTMQYHKGIQCGSGILLQIGEEHFLITAAHTFDRLKEANDLPLFMTSGLIGENLIPLYGVTRRTSQTKDPIHRRDDPFDVCVCEIPKEMAAMVKRKRFLHLNEVDPFDSFDPRSWYMVFGCPTQWNPSDDDGKRVFSTACSLNTFVYCDERGGVPNIDKEIQIAFDFNPDTCVPDNPGDPVPPNPGGMSGCGIWRLVAAESETTRWKVDDIRLVAFEHSWERVFRVLKGTRIRYALQLIRRNHEKLWPAFSFHYGERARSL